MLPPNAVPSVPARAWLLPCCCLVTDSFENVFAIAATEGEHEFAVLTAWLAATAMGDLVGYRLRRQVPSYSRRPLRLPSPRPTALLLMNMLSASRGRRQVVEARCHHYRRTCRRKGEAVDEGAVGDADRGREAVARAPPKVWAPAAWF